MVFALPAFLASPVGQAAIGAGVTGIESLLSRKAGKRAKAEREALAQQLQDISASTSRKVPPEILAEIQRRATTGESARDTATFREAQESELGRFKRGTGLEQESLQRALTRSGSAFSPASQSRQARLARDIAEREDAIRLSQRESETGRRQALQGTGIQEQFQASQLGGQEAQDRLQAALQAGQIRGVGQPYKSPLEGVGPALFSKGLAGLLPANETPGQKSQRELMEQMGQYYQRSGAAAPGKPR